MFKQYKGRLCYLLISLQFLVKTLFEEERRRTGKLLRIEVFEDTEVKPKQAKTEERDRKMA